MDMTNSSMLRQVPRVFAAVALAASVAGCYTLARVPSGYITNQKPATVFVRDAEGSVYSLSQPEIVHDSLVGNDGEEKISVNLREVDAIGVRAISRTRTAGAIGATVGVVGMLTFGIIKATSAKDCARVANRNSQCIGDIQGGCKYGACDEDTAFPTP